jgi:methionyl-tRNA synthetase
LHEYLQDFPGKQDVLRYVLCATAPETKDNDFTWKDFQARNNNELAAVYGNFVNRVLNLMARYFDGVVPEPGAFTTEDKTVLDFIAQQSGKIGDALEKYKFREALSAYMGIARTGNKYLADQEPWKVIKTDEERVKTILYVATQVCGLLAQAGEPFLPFSSEKLRGYLGLELLKWEDIKTYDFVKSGSPLEKGEILFQKIEDVEVDKQLEKLKPEPELEEENTKVSPLKDEIGFEDFMKMDIRTGTILEAEAVPKTDKLLKLLVDIGVEKRTIVSGIAQDFKPEEIIGKQVSVLANLAPKKLRGVESKGMILMAEDSDGKLTFAAPTDTIENGSIVR